MHWFMNDIKDDLENTRIILNRNGTERNTKEIIEERGTKFNQVYKQLNIVWVHESRDQLVTNKIVTLYTMDTMKCKHNTGR